MHVKNRHPFRTALNVTALIYSAGTRFIVTVMGMFSCCSEHVSK